MAHSIAYWYDLMVLEKQNSTALQTFTPLIDDSQTLMADLNSTSKVSRWRLMLWVIATLAYAQEVLYDLLLIELNDLAERSRYGTLPWYVKIAKEFQYGDSLVQTNLEWGYNPINTTNRIVVFAAAKDGISGGTVNVKVAKSVSGQPVPLNNVEESALVGYFAKRKPAGILVNVINHPADDIRLYLTVNYDPLVLTSTGESIANSGTFPVEDAIDVYRKSLSFDGRFELMKLIDAIQTASGVISAYVTNASARYAANPFVSFSESYYPYSGYVQIDPLTPLTSTISYVPNV